MFLQRPVKVLLSKDFSCGMRSIQGPVGGEKQFITGVQLLFFLIGRSTVICSEEGPVNIEGCKHSVCVQQNRQRVGRHGCVSVVR